MNLRNLIRNIKAIIRGGIPRVTLTSPTTVTATRARSARRAVKVAFALIDARTKLYQTGSVVIAPWQTHGETTVMTVEPAWSVVVTTGVQAL